MDDATIAARVARVRELAAGVLVPKGLFDKFLTISTGSGGGAKTFAGLTITENPFLPDDTIVFTDKAGLVLNVVKF